jgi:hypothetical protein
VPLQTREYGIGLIDFFTTVAKRSIVICNKYQRGMMKPGKDCILSPQSSHKSENETLKKIKNG